MNTTISKMHKISPSIKKIIITKIPQLSNNEDVDGKIRKYTTSFSKRSPFLNRQKKRIIDNNNEKKSSLFHTNINNFNSFNVNKILKQYNNISKKKTEDENTTAITDEVIRKNNLKKVTFSIVEIIRVESYKKYNKIINKLNSSKETKPLRDIDYDDQCFMF